MSMREQRHADPEGHNIQDSNYYGISLGIAGLLIGFLLITFMVALADRFS